jgi:histidinol-phosphate aminotransferase
LVREFDRVVVLRTFETWAGLSSLPISYAIGPPTIVTALNSAILLRVGGGSLIAAHASLDDARSVNYAIARIKDEKARMYRMLRKLNMVRPMPSWANFVLVRVERGDPSLYPDALLRHDIRVHIPEQPELEGYFRISAVSHEATATLRAALIDIGQAV